MNSSSYKMNRIQVIGKENIAGGPKNNKVAGYMFQIANSHRK